MPAKKQAFDPNGLPKRWPKRGCGIELSKHGFIRFYPPSMLDMWRKRDRVRVRRFVKDCSEALAEIARRKGGKG